MKHIFKILFLFLPALAFAQGGTWPVKYNDSDPSGAPSAAGTRIHFNTATNTLWFWEPAPSSQWRKQPKSFDQITGCAAPGYTPSARQSTFAVNSCSPKPELYQWTGSAWALLNPATLYTAGTGISIASGVISNTGDLSATNELNVALYIDGGSLKLDDEQTTVSIPLSQFRNGIYSAGTGIAINGSGVISATDASTTNEIQTLSIAGQNLSLSLGGGTVAIPITNIYNSDGALTGNRTVDGATHNLTLTNFTSLSFGGDNLSFEGQNQTFLANNNILIKPTNDLSIEVENSSTVTIGDGLGFRYTEEYPDILTNDRSIPDVGLTKDLIASENGALGTGFVNGGGTGTIPASTIANLAGEFNFAVNGVNDYSFGRNDTPGNEFGDVDFLGWFVDVDNYTGYATNSNGDNEPIFRSKFRVGDTRTELYQRYGLLSFFSGSPDGAAYFNAQNGGFSMAVQPVGESFPISLDFNANGAKITDGRTVKKGLEYDGNYAAGFTARSLVDKGYVDSNDANGIYGGSGNAFDTGTAKMRRFTFKTDDNAGYNPDGFNSQLTFGGYYDILTGAFSTVEGYSSFVAGTPGSDSWAQFTFDGEQGLIDIKSKDAADNVSAIQSGAGGIYVNVNPVSGGSFALSADALGLIFADNRTTKKGIEYNAKYSNIKTNDRSIPDVELVKELIASEADNIYNTDGTIPAAAYRTATIGAASALDFQYSNAATAFKISDDEEFVEIRSKDGNSFLNFSNVGASLVTPTLTLSQMDINIADATIANLAGDFSFVLPESDYPSYTFGRQNYLGDYNNFFGTYLSETNYFGAGYNTAGDGGFGLFASFSNDIDENSTFSIAGDVGFGFSSSKTGVGNTTFRGDNGVLYWNANNKVELTLSPTFANFKDSRTTKVGLQYDGNYGSTFTDRSLVDKGYVDSHSGSALGTGFVNGGGTGTIPSGTVAEMDGNSIVFSTTNAQDLSAAIGFKKDEDNYFLLGNNDNVDGQYTASFRGKIGDYRTSYSVDGYGLSIESTNDGLSVINLAVGGGGATLVDNITQLGFTYGGDYSTTIKTNARSLPDVGTVNILKQTLSTYTTTARDAISSPATGYIIFCTDCTATDSSTGVQQVWNGSAWKNAW